MLRRLLLCGFASLCLVLPARSALALGKEEPCFTNGVPDGTLTANWKIQASKRDPQLTALLVGTWRSQAPNGVGGIAYSQATYHPEGTLTFERRTCVSMEGLGTSCPATIGHGYWAAHYSDGQTVFLATNVTFSGYDRVRRAGNCSGGYFRFVDRDTTMDQQGATSRRAQ